jgi:hypothetical protein
MYSRIYSFLKGGNFSSCRQMSRPFFAAFQGKNITMSASKHNTAISFFPNVAVPLTRRSLELSNYAGE